jgi:hypothetical protein
MIAGNFLFREPAVPVSIAGTGPILRKAGRNYTTGSGKNLWHVTVRIYVSPLQVHDHYPYIPGM